MQVDVYNIEKKKVGSVELPDEIFKAEVKQALLWEQVKAQRANTRRGTHSTKTRGEVSGGGSMPWTRTIVAAEVRNGEPKVIVTRPSSA